MLETKSLTVSPNAEQNTINLMQDFGWNLKSSQEINNTDSHLEDRGGTTYSVTTKENYVKLIFERDTKMENYSKITDLETKYHRIMNAEPTQEYIPISKFITIIGLILYIIPGVLYLAYKIFKRMNAKTAYENKYSEWQAEVEKAKRYRQEARSLL